MRGVCYITLRVECYLRNQVMNYYVQCLLI